MVTDTGTPSPATPATADPFTTALVAALAEWQNVETEHIEPDEPRYQLAAFAFDGGLEKARDCIDNADRASIAALHAFEVLENIRPFIRAVDRPEIEIVSETLIGLVGWAEKLGTGAAQPYLEYARPSGDRR